MRPLPFLIMLAIVSISGSMLFAAEPPASGTPGANEQQDDGKTAPGAKKPSPQRFIPTEQVRADFDVSFPIDI